MGRFKIESKIAITSLVMLLALNSCAKRTATVENISPLTSKINTTMEIDKDRVVSGTEEIITEPLSMLDPKVNEKGIYNGEKSSGTTGDSQSKDNVQGLKDVFYDFDMANLSGNEINVIKKDGEWLNKNKSAIIRVEGYADERGTNEYNLTLGEKRAQVVKKYLTSLGIAPSRIDIITFGEEKGFCAEHNEECWTQNRRGHFVLVGK